MALTDQAKLSLRAGLGEAAGKEVQDYINSTITKVSNGPIKLAGGSVATANAASHALVTGLDTVVAVNITITGSGAPTDITTTVTIDGSSVTVYFWKATAAGDTAMTAATAVHNFTWIAVGS
jgi:hypothetical protein